MSCEKLPKQKNIVFLTGWGFESSIFHAMGVSLTPNCYFLNLPEVSDKTYWVKDVLENLIIQIPNDSILIGWSLGGLLAINLCNAFSDKFTKLILVASTPKFISSSRWPGIPLREVNHFMGMAQKDIQKTLSKFLKLTEYPFTGLDIDSYLNKSHSSKSILFYLKFLMNTDYRELYCSLTLPTLHLLGGKDALIPANTITALKPSAHIKFKKIKDAGHLPFITHFETTQKIIKKFILA